MATQNLFIDTETLSQNLGREDLVIIDVRGDCCLQLSHPWGGK